MNLDRGLIQEVRMEINLKNVRFNVPEGWQAVLFVGGGYDHQVWTDPGFDPSRHFVIIPVMNCELVRLPEFKEGKMITDPEFSNTFKDETYVRWGTICDDKVVVFVKNDVNIMEKLLGWYPLRVRENEVGL